MSYRTDDLLDLARDNVNAQVNKLVDAEYVRLLEKEVETLLNNGGGASQKVVARALVDYFPQHKILCIKAFRSIFGTGLKDSKDAIDLAAQPWASEAGAYEALPRDLPF